MLQFLFIFAIIVVVSWILLLYVLPMILGYQIRKMARKGGLSPEGGNGKEKKGDVRIDYVPEKPSRFSEMGDYVDYEEIKEK